jgi:uncharacterized protein (TIGR04141 family)
MQYNVFKVKNRTNLITEMENKGYERKGTEVNSNDYKLKLYCRYDNNQKISWKTVFDVFEEENIPKKSNLSGIILCHNDNNCFALTYGNSSFLVQKFCDKEFGFDFAKRVPLIEMKRKSSYSAASTRNSSIVSYRNTKTFVYDTGENVTSLSFTPENEFYGNRIDIGKSIKFNLDLELPYISELFDEIISEMDKPVINHIPLLVEIKNEEQVCQLYEQFYNDFRLALEQFSQNRIDVQQNNLVINEFTVVGCDYFFENDNNFVLKIGRQKYEINELDLKTLFNISIRNLIDIQTLVEKGRLVYMDDSSESIYSDPIKNHINYEIRDEKICFYEGSWYEYNADYLELVNREVSTIAVTYKRDDSFTKAQIAQMDGLYREDKINKYLSDKYNGRLLDRNNFIVKYENESTKNTYRVEIADLVLDNQYFSVKVGSAQSLSYCIDQSILASNIVHSRSIDLEENNMQDIKTFGLWFYLETTRFFDYNPLSLLNINSIMLLSKLSLWSVHMKQKSMQPIIYISQYID